MTPELSEYETINLIDHRLLSALEDPGDAPLGIGTEYIAHAALQRLFQTKRWPSTSNEPAAVSAHLVLGLIKIIEELADHA